MGKKNKKQKSSRKRACAECKNFKHKSGSKGLCRRKEKKRRADDSVCDHFDPA